MDIVNLRSILVLLAASYTTCAHAQDNEVVETAQSVTRSADGATVIYDSSYFAQYEPISALDMLRWVPGAGEFTRDRFGGGGGGQERGFGSGGDQLLINGKRLSGKSNDVSSAIQRIQASSVERIEVIRGTASGLDVRSEGMIVNIVMREDADDGAGSWRVHVGDYAAGGTEWDALVSYGRSHGRFKYLVSAEYGPYNRGSGNYIEETFLDPAGQVTETRVATGPEMQDDLILIGGASWSFRADDVANLNFKVVDGERNDGETTIASIVGVPDTETAVDSRLRESVEWELGGDIENAIGPGRLKTRMIFTNEDEDETEIVSLISSLPGDIPDSSMFVGDEKQTESIIRSSYTWSPWDAHTLEAGAEAARNTLDKAVMLFEVLPNGDLIEIPLFNSESKVTEDRYEIFVTDFWSLSDDKILEAAVNIETSKIVQTGLDIYNSRSFEYVKPRFDFRWDLNEHDQFRATLERTISQLNFGDFVSSFDDDRVDGGNPDLEPEKAWELQGTWEHRFAGDGGLISGKLFYHDIEDHIDRILIIDDITGPGNIGDAQRWGAELKTSFRLGRIGMEGAVLDLTYTLQDSETTDPFSGVTREMRNTARHSVQTQFRHDIPAWKLNYTIEANWNSERTNIGYDRVTVDQRKGPMSHFTLNYRMFDTTTLYFQARVVNEGINRRIRDRYDGPVIDGNLLRTEIRDRQFEREFIIGLRGNF